MYEMRTAHGKTTRHPKKQFQKSDCPLANVDSGVCILVVRLQTINDGEKAALSR
jgi:hypothetical protein